MAVEDERNEIIADSKYIDVVDSPDGSTTIYTIGTSRRNSITFFKWFDASPIRRVLDVRLRNRSHLLGFTKYPDLRYLLMRISGVDCRHRPDFAPTDALLDDYRKNRIDWPTYERRFNQIIAERRIADMMRPEDLNNACLLCSEHEPDKCHRRLVAEYFQRKWGNVRIRHIL